MSALYRLPNGNWIDLTTVVAIRVAEEVTCSITKSHFDERVLVHWGVGGVECMFPSSAREFADELAELVNAARAKAQP